jgi:hypothetical protein
MRSRSKMRPYHILPALLSSALLSNGKAAMASEKPRYRVVRALEGFEVRAYEGYLVAETDVAASHEDAGSVGFRTLAAYIFGKNRGEKKIAMTAPVMQAGGCKIAMTAPVTQARREGDDGASLWGIQFMMPGSYTLETLPEPLDPAVRLRQVPARRVAALSYSGTWAESRYLEKLDELREAMRREGLKPAGEPTWARYDPPYVPRFMRRNEILIEVDG